MHTFYMERSSPFRLKEGASTVARSEFGRAEVSF